MFSNHVHLKLSEDLRDHPATNSRPSGQQTQWVSRQNRDRQGALKMPEWKMKEWKMEELERMESRQNI